MHTSTVEEKTHPLLAAIQDNSFDTIDTILKENPPTDDILAKAMQTLAAGAIKTEVHTACFNKLLAQPNGAKAIKRAFIRAAADNAEALLQYYFTFKIIADEIAAKDSETCITAMSIALNNTSKKTVNWLLQTHTGINIYFASLKKRRASFEKSHANEIYDVSEFEAHVVLRVLKHVLEHASSNNSAVLNNVIALLTLPSVKKLVLANYPALLAITTLKKDEMFNYVITEVQKDYETEQMLKQQLSPEDFAKLQTGLKTRADCIGFEPSIFIQINDTSVKIPHKSIIELLAYIRDNQAPVDLRAFPGFRDGKDLITTPHFDFITAKTVPTASIYTMADFFMHKLMAQFFAMPPFAGDATMLATTVEHIAPELKFDPEIFKGKFIEAAARCDVAEMVRFATFPNVALELKTVRSSMVLDAIKAAIEATGIEPERKKAALLQLLYTEKGLENYYILLCSRRNAFVLAHPSEAFDVDPIETEVYFELLLEIFNIVTESKPSIEQLKYYEDVISKLRTLPTLHQLILSRIAEFDAIANRQPGDTFLKKFLQGIREDDASFKTLAATFGAARAQAIRTACAATGTPMSHTVVLDDPASIDRAKALLAAGVPLEEYTFDQSEPLLQAVIDGADEAAIDTLLKQSPQREETLRDAIILAAKKQNTVQIIQLAGYVNGEEKIGEKALQRAFIIAAQAGDNTRLEFYTQFAKIADNLKRKDSKMVKSAMTSALQKNNKETAMWLIATPHGIGYFFDVLTQLKSDYERDHPEQVFALSAVAVEILYELLQTEAHAAALAEYRSRITDELLRPAILTAGQSQNTAMIKKFASFTKGEEKVGKNALQKAFISAAKAGSVMLLEYFSTFTIIKDVLATQGSKTVKTAMAFALHAERRGAVLWLANTQFGFDVYYNDVAARRNASSNKALFDVSDFEADIIIAIVTRLATSPTLLSRSEQLAQLASLPAVFTKLQDLLPPGMGESMFSPENRALMENPAAKKYHALLSTKIAKHLPPTVAEAFSPYFAAAAQETYTAAEDKLAEELSTKFLVTSDSLELSGLTPAQINKRATELMTESVRQLCQLSATPQPAQPVVTPEPASVTAEKAEPSPEPAIVAAREDEAPTEPALIAASSSTSLSTSVGTDTAATPASASASAIASQAEEIDDVAEIAANKKKRAAFYNRLTMFFAAIAAFIVFLLVRNYAYSNTPETVNALDVVDDDMWTTSDQHLSTTLAPAVELTKEAGNGFLTAFRNVTSANQTYFIQQDAAEQESPGQSIKPLLMP